MNPLASLSILVQAKGIAELNRQLSGLDGDLRKTAQNASKAADGLEDTGKRGNKAMGALKKTAMALGGIVVGAGLVRGLKGAVDAFEESRKVAKQTEAVIKATGGAANVTAKQVGDLAGAISKKTGVDDEAIQKGSNLLLTFKNIRNEAGKGRDIFNQTTKAAVDLSAAGFGSIESTSKQLGKALNDPIKGMSALGRSGVTFSEDQKKAIKALLDTGKASDRVKAQQLILAEVQSQVGGSAEAQATASDKMRVALGNVQEAIGGFLIPVIDKAAGAFASLLTGMQDGTGVGGRIVGVFKSVGGAVGSAIGAVSGLVGWFRQHETVAVALAAAIGVVLAAFAGFKALAAVQAAIVAVRGAMLALNAAFLTNPIVLIVAGLAALTAALVVAYKESETFRKIVDAVFGFLKDAATTVFGFLKDFIPGVWNTIRGATETTWNIIKAVLSVVFEVIKTLVTTYFTVYKTVITTAWEAVKTVTTTVWNAIKAILNTAWDVIKGAADIAWEGIRLAVLTPIRTARDALATIWTAISTVAGTAWDGLKTVAGTAWDGIRAAVVTPIREARDVISGVWHSIGTRASEAWGNLKDGATEFANGLKEKITGAFKGAANSVITFVNAILKAVNAIPGVPNIGLIDKLAEGGVHGMARGGAFARTGGLVNHPITLMGEEAPRHPEFVIPTNPAYRSRAQMLLGKAAGAIGLAKGGTFDSTSYGPPWGGINGTGVTATGVNLRNNPAVYGIAVDPAVIQLGERVRIQPNPFGYKGQFKAFDTGGAIKGNRIDFYDWRGRQAQMAWGRRQVQVSGINEGGLSGILEAASGAVGAVTGVMGDLLSMGAKFILDKLPGIGDLPDWLSGLGKYALDNVTDWIKDKVTGLVGSEPLSQTNIGGSGWKTNTRAVAAQVAQYAGLTLGSNYRNPMHNAAVGGVPNSLHTHGSPLNPGAWDLNGPAANLYKGQAYARQHFPQLMENLVHDVGSGLHLHLGFFRKGGMFGGAPFVGSYANGGVIPQDGMAYVHKGETVTPAGRGGGIQIVQNIDKYIVGDPNDERRHHSQWAFRLEQEGALNL